MIKTIHFHLQSDEKLKPLHIVIINISSNYIVYKTEMIAVGPSIHTSIPA